MLLRNLPRSTQTNRLRSMRPIRVKTHLTAEKPAAGKAIAKSDPAPPAPLHISHAEQTELWRHERVAIAN
jgi:hypothetical protein